MWIEASAGTGKTYFICKYITKYKNKNVVIITHTNAAIQQLKNKIQSQNVHISTIHSMCYKIIQQISVYNYHDYDSILDIVSSLNTLELNIDLLIIDEAQDTSYKQWNVIKHILNVTKCEILIVGDSKQIIYENSDTNLYKSIQNELKLPYMTLQKSYRHSIEITKYINTIYDGHTTALNEKGKVNSTEYNMTNTLNQLKYEVERLKEKSYIILVDSRNNYYHKIVNILKCRNYMIENSDLILYSLYPNQQEYFHNAAKSFNFSNYEIKMCENLLYSVYYSFKKQNFKLAAPFQTLNFKIQEKINNMFEKILNNDCFEYIIHDKQKILQMWNEFKINKVSNLFLFAQYIRNFESFNYSISTIHQAKGLEFDYVLFPFCLKNNHGFFSDTLYKKMKYVAATRAKKYLWINNYNN